MLQNLSELTIENNPIEKERWLPKIVSEKFPGLSAANI